MVLCGQVYCFNCILKSVLVKDRIHTSIRNKKDSKSLGKAYSFQSSCGQRCSAVAPHLYQRKAMQLNPMQIQA